LYLAGYVPIDLLAEVSLDGRRLRKYSLRAGVFETIDIGPLDHPGSLTVRFSAHVIDQVGRRVSFLVQDTNLFSEHDLMPAAA
jgi:hypothetical protein